MSLKAFHVVFLAASILLMLFLATWCYGGYRRTGEAMNLVWMATSGLSAVVLLVYGRYFLKKLKHISYL
jgi:hypothetical protein